MRAGQRREQILASAAQCFSAGGYAATSLDQVAAEAGISKPVLYDHFASKDELFLEVLRSLRDHLLASGKAELSKGASLELGYQAAVTFLFQFAGRAPHEAVLLFTPPQGDAAIVEAARSIQDEATRQLALVVQKASPSKSKGTSVIVAEFLKSGLHGAILWWLRHPELQAEDAARAVTNLSWLGLNKYAD